MTQAAASQAENANGPFPPEFFDDPYPFYAQLRQMSPAFFIEPLNAWILTGYDVVYNASLDERFGVNYEEYQANRMGPSVVDEPFFKSARHSMVCNDPPDHTRMRRVFARGFTSRRVRELPTFTERYANEVLDEADGRIDLVPDYARRIPLAVLSHILGVPQEDWARMETWVQNYSPVLEVFPMTPEQLALANEAAEGLDNYFRGMVEERRAKPVEDFVSEVVLENDQLDQPLSEDELVSNLGLVYFGGHDTQEKMFSNIVNTLDGHRSQLDYLQENPLERTEQAIPELLRYDTVGQFMGRCLREDTDYAGVTMRPGQTIMLCYGAANRDPEAFPDPDSLDFNRSGKPAANISFGAGRHRCIGAALVAQNLPIMLRVLLERARTLNVVRPEVRRHMSMATRGFDAFPITWD